MTIERVNPPELATPRGFSHAVIGTGTIAFLAGQTAMDAEGRIRGDREPERVPAAADGLPGDGGQRQQHYDRKPHHRNTDSQRRAVTT